MSDETTGYPVSAIRQLQIDAHVGDDVEMVLLCERALTGDVDAMEWLAMVVGVRDACQVDDEDEPLEYHGWNAIIAAREGRGLLYAWSPDGRGYRRIEVEEAEIIAATDASLIWCEVDELGGGTR